VAAQLRHYQIPAHERERGGGRWFMGSLRLPGTYRITDRDQCSVAETEHFLSVAISSITAIILG
jgi:hypothetical protein